MKTTARLGLLILSTLLSGATAAQTPPGWSCLLQAYPDFWQPGQVFEPPAVLRNRLGMSSTYDEGKVQLPYNKRLYHADLKSQMAQPYAAGFPMAVPERNQDPGRQRAQAFFLAMYGATAAQVQQHLIAVPWAPNGQTLLFTRLNGAAQALERVGARLAKQANTARYVSRPAGSLNWRAIAGTTRLSMHAWGAAIDFTLPHGLGHYWRWSGCSEESTCTYPAAVLQDATLQQVVQAFEREGFIWGGKWAHFDTVHFEYRPELVGPSCQNQVPVLAP